MGLLIEGVWCQETGPKIIGQKPQISFRQWITADGSSGFKASPGRYHLYISLACPWACRTLIFRLLKGLEDIISLSIVDPFMGEQGWAFSEGPDCIPDTVNGFDYLYQIYQKAHHDYTGRVSVPVLWDKETQTIVNNESSDIIRMFNQEFNEFCDAHVDFYPPHLRDDIDRVNEDIYQFINIGVYKCGFATNQQDYEIAFDALFNYLDVLEKKLSKSRYLVGDQITEADWRLFCTLIRFDIVYYTHFKCNLRRISDYLPLEKYLQTLYQYKNVAKTVNAHHIKQHYYLSHKHINPSGIVPKGPETFLGSSPLKESLFKS